MKRYNLEADPRVKADLRQRLEAELRKPDLMALEVFASRENSVTGDRDRDRKRRKKQQADIQLS